MQYQNPHSRTTRLLHTNALPDGARHWVTVRIAEQNRADYSFSKRWRVVPVLVPTVT